MRTGKISENVLIRSVFRRIKTKREEVKCGAGVGTDCAVLAFAENEETVLSTNPVSAPADMVCAYALHRALNNVAAAGGEPVGVMISAMLPEELEEKRLQDMMQQAEDICACFHVQLIGGHTECSAALTMPVLTVTCVGKRAGDHTRNIRDIRPGQDVVISKWIGLEGSVRIAREYKEDLLTRYPSAMIEEAAAFERFLSVIPEAATAVKSGVCAMHSIAEGGIFGALWEMASGAGVGLEIDWKKIPIKQETVEICELFEISPYELASVGCLLMTTERGHDLVRVLEKEGIAASVIGKTTDNNDRVVVNGEERRFLEMPKQDELYKVFG